MEVDAFFLGGSVLGSGVSGSLSSVQTGFEYRQTTAFQGLELEELLNYWRLWSFGPAPSTTHQPANEISMQASASQHTSWLGSSALGSSRKRLPKYGSRLVCAVLVNSNSLTANYGVKQSQFIKPTSEPVLVTLKNLMRPLTVRLEDGYCSTTVANQHSVTVIRFVWKSYTHL